MDLNKLVDSVETEEDFLNFLIALAVDREDEVEKEKTNPSSPYGPGANGWENGNIESFLGAAFAWGQSSKEGLEFYEKSSNPWKRAAQIIYAGKYYE